MLQQLGRHEHARGALEHRAHERALECFALVVEALEASAVQLDQHRATHGERHADERGVAPEALHRQVRVHGEAHPARRSGEYVARGRERRIEVIDRPAFEEALRGSANDRGDAAARLRRYEHDEALLLHWRSIIEPA